MKVSIITILDNSNFGTYLQALSSALTIKSLGHEVEIVRYTRECMTKKGLYRAILEDRGFIKWIYNVIRQTGNNAFYLREKDYQFLMSFVPVTQEYVGYGALVENPPIADVYMTGSDQVWNSIYNRGIDKSFFLGFAPEGKTRVSYAASFGMVSIPEKEETETLSLLRKYQHITVREDSAKHILSHYGIDSNVVLDPTLLMNKKQWLAIAGKFKFECNEKYLLTYSVEYGKEDSYIEHYAKTIAKEKGLKIYHVSYSPARLMPKYADKCYPSATPDVFLNLMLNASFVVVSSFHGTAFSINFNKQFITVLPKRFNTRVASLLKIAELEDRSVQGLDLDTKRLKEIDYDNVNKILDYERVKSINLLRDMIKE